ncbi:hypothetical protein J5N97_026416 [Dioscorea zingiberensis]|uniref:Endonuclease/exonuclease/phosphatase domain-containing protein n=1 Tax=Dioscorea zingiberensis TaxID=325984 RepID=A0A9D5C378_9LILI|nr:hypothetical protein J5N97_026416 [Dioscorea zingiberensis]
MMRVLQWNCRGASGRDTVDRIQWMLNNLDVTILCLVETRADNERISRFCEKFKRKWEWAAIPAMGYSGGIIILWKKNIGKATPIAISRYALHLILTLDDESTWIISTVYNNQLVAVQQSTWEELSKLATIQNPWIINGDFNAIRCNEDRKGGAEGNRLGIKSKQMNSFLINNNLMELNTLDSPYTWCNNQRGTARIWAKLDRFFVNED